MALEINAYGNLPRAVAYREACNAKGIKFFVWMTRSGQPENDFDFSATEARRAVVESGAQGFIAEGEVPAYANGQPNPQEQNWPALVFMLKDLDIPKAVATSFGPFTDAQGLPDANKAKVLIENGWHLLPYVYPAEHKNVSIETQTGYSRHYTHERAPNVLAPGQGWYAPQPVLGVYSGPHGSFTIADFPTKDKCISWSAYAAEYVV